MQITNFKNVTIAMTSAVLLLGHLPLCHAAQLRGNHALSRQLQFALPSGGGVLTTAGTVGGNGGSPFNDLDVLQEREPFSNDGLRVTEVFIAGGDLVGCVGMRYSDGSVRRHGRQCDNPRTLQLGEGEFVSRVEIWSTTHRYGSPPYCPYNSNFRSVSQIRVTSSSGESILMGTTSGHGSFLCRYSQNPQYTSIQATGTRVAIVGFHGRDGDIIDQLGVVALEVPLFNEATVRDRSIPESEFSSDVATALTKQDKLVYIQNTASGRFLDELANGRITTSTDQRLERTPWTMAEVACHQRSYDLYADANSGKKCYNIRNPAMETYLGNNGVHAFEHSGRGDDDILGSYVVEADSQCTGRGEAAMRCPVQIVSSFYTDRKVLTDYSGSSDYLTLEEGDPSASQWVLIFEEETDLALVLAASASEGSIQIRNDATKHYLNELEDGTVSSVLDLDHQVGDNWNLVDTACPNAADASDELCYSLVSSKSKMPLEGGAALRIEKNGNEKCYFAADDQDVLACFARIVMPSSAPGNSDLCLGQARDSDAVTFVDCFDQADGYFVEWLLLF